MKFLKNAKKIFDKTKEAYDEHLAEQFTCPYCISTYPKSKILYVCDKCNQTVVPGKFELGIPKCKSQSPNTCYGRATVRRCPYCSKDLQGAMLDCPNLPFSIVGVTSSGKTNYITVMLQELPRSSGLELTLAPLTKETQNHQQENYTTIYEGHTPPKATEAIEKSDDMLAQIWSIKNSQRRNKILKRVPTYTFTIFDGAGENHRQNLTPNDPVCRYIAASEAVILMIDPLTIPAVRKGMVDATVLQNSLGGHKGKNENIEEILASLANYIKSAKGIGMGKMLNIPVAVVLSKFDVILENSSFANALVKNRDSLVVQNGVFSFEEIQQISEEIRNWFEEIGETTLLNALDANFTHYRFFGVSSYGAPPLGNNTLPNEIKPHRVLDPILWLFKLNNFID